MLTSLHVKNLAVIQNEEVTFAPGLNILTGETGAGKSILLGSVGLAFGDKANKNLIRQGEEYAYVELTFRLDDTCKSQAILRALAEEDLFPDNQEFILSRKITDSRSTARINGEAVSNATLRTAASLLMDIHGQQDNAVLLKKRNHMELLDAFGGEALSEKKSSVRKAYSDFQQSRKQLDEAAADLKEREHTLLIVRHEIEEIEQADLVSGEDETLEQEFKKLSNSRIIIESVGSSYQALGSDRGILDLLGNCINDLHHSCEYDDALQAIGERLSDAESILIECNHDLGRYLDHFEYSEERFSEIEQRLDLINHLKMKYGSSIEEILKYYEKQKEKESKLLNYEAYLESLKEEFSRNREFFCQEASELSGIRKETALNMEQQVSDHMRELNFSIVNFQIHLSAKEVPDQNGFETVQFCVSLNPGEPVKPLDEIASGGELSRIMLAIKTAMSDKDQIPTLIFDEIDAGISGMTAQKVAEKMHLISRDRQVLCITHLPQIAAMADHHYIIQKEVGEDFVCTHINELNEEESVMEIARILGGNEITTTVINNAKELKEKAK